MEDLVEMDDIEDPEQKLKHKKVLVGGPFRLKGSDQIVMFYNHKLPAIKGKGLKKKGPAGKNQWEDLSSKYVQRVYTIPNSTKASLLNHSSSNKVKLSTFLDKDTILLQLKDRFMIFNKNGDFIGNV